MLCKDFCLYDDIYSNSGSLTRQQEIDSSVLTMCTSSSFPPDSSHPRAHRPLTSTPGQHTARELFPTSPPQKQSVAQPPPPRMHIQQHMSEPIPGSTHSDSEIQDEGFNSCLPRITTGNSQVAAPPSTNQYEPPFSSYSSHSYTRKQTATAPESMPGRVLDSSHSTRTSAPGSGPVTEEVVETEEKSISSKSSVSPIQHASSPASNSSRGHPPTSIVPMIHPHNEKVIAVDKKKSSTTPSSDTDDGAQDSLPSSTTTAESSADQPATPPDRDRHQIQRQEGHESKDRNPGSTEETPQTNISPLLSPGRDGSRDSASPGSPDDKNTCVIKVRPRLQIDSLTSLSLANNRFSHLYERGYRRAEVTVHLGQEPAGTYWFLLPGKTTMQAIERALDEACQNGTKTASLEYEFWKLSDTDFSPSIETPDIAHWERLNPVSSTSNLRLVELRVLNACRNGFNNVTCYYGIGDSSMELEEELSEDSVLDFLTTIVDTCYSSEAGDRYGTELRFVFSHPK